MCALKGSGTSQDGKFFIVMELLGQNVAELRGRPRWSPALMKVAGNLAVHWVLACTEASYLGQATAWYCKGDTSGQLPARPCWRPAAKKVAGLGACALRWAGALEGWSPGGVKMAHEAQRSGGGAPASALH